MDKCFISERLFFREITLKDSDVIVCWRSNPLNYRFFYNNNPITKKMHIEWFINSYLNDESRIDLMALDKKTNTPVGVFGIKTSSPNSNVAEISYLLDPSFQGQGLATEAVKALIDWGVVSRNISCFWANIHKDNIKSKNLINRLGFIFQGIDGNFEKYYKNYNI